MGTFDGLSQASERSPEMESPTFRVAPTERILQDGLPNVGREVCRYLAVILEATEMLNPDLLQRVGEQHHRVVRRDARWRDEVGSALDLDALDRYRRDSFDARYFVPDSFYLDVRSSLDSTGATILAALDVDVVSDTMALSISLAKKRTETH